jgi:phosphatidylglycerol:prolipoprotein diacylglycerol transferase
MVALAALAGVWLFRRELDQAGLAADAVDAALIGVMGGLLGAKLLYVAEHLGEEPLAGLLFARAGLSWYGGFAGGVGAGLLTLMVKHLPLVPVLAAATPALALGHAIGRIGCLLVGDDYGRPTDLPWGIAFPQGAPPTVARVHPTQIYEAVFLVALPWTLVRWRRRGLPDAHVLGRYLTLVGTGRFLLEFIRVNVRVALDLTVAQWASLLVISAGLVLVVAPALRTRAGSLHLNRAGSQAGIQ